MRGQTGTVRRLFTLRTPFVALPQDPKKNAQILTSGTNSPKLSLDKMSDPPRRRVVAAPARRPPAELRSVKVIVEEDPDPDTSYLNPDGLAALKCGDFNFVIVRAEADVVIENTTQTLSSSGTCGIESDADEYLEQVVEHEWGVLRNVLKTVGVPTEQLPIEIDRAWIEWRM